jgi:YD repeat-containing protein
VICLIGSDPAFDRLWTANAVCTAPPDTGSTLTTRITNFSYDFEGRLAQINSPEGYINYEYDVATGRHTRTCTASSEFTYQYDALGRLWKVNVLKRNGSPVSETTTYDYTEVGNRKSVTLPGAVGIKTSYAYDTLNRLTGLTNRASDNSILSQFNYQVDATGRRTNATEIVTTEGATPTYQTNTLSWAHDGLAIAGARFASRTAGRPRSPINTTPTISCSGR